jgi:hypothetical protein
MIVRWNIVELALDFHGDDMDGPLRGISPLVSAFLDQPGCAVALAPRYHENER